MTTFDQSNRQSNGPGNSQSSTGSSNQNEQDSSFVAVDPEQELEIGDEDFIFGEVRRVERAGNRQSGEGQNESGRQGERSDSQQSAPDTSGSTGV